MLSLSSWFVHSVTFTVLFLLQSDAISNLEKEQDYREEHFDYIQQWLRKFCLKCKKALEPVGCFSHSLIDDWFLSSCPLADGAALFYSSVKEEKNCELLQRYLLHRIYDFPFNTPAFVVERDSVFVSVSTLSYLHSGVAGLNVNPLLAALQVGTRTRKSVFCSKV